MRCRLLLFFSLLSIICFAQSQYTSSVKDGSSELLVDAVTARYKNDVTALTGINKKYVADIYKERYELIKKMFDHDAIIVHNDAGVYLAVLSNEILKANPQLNSSDLRILFSKAWWANASSMGEGTILFNIGLFNRLENESQAAFVICHELAHYYLNHGNNSINNYVNTVYSDEFQKKLRSIQKTDYRQNQLLENVAKNITFRSRKHSREFEQAADSMAIEFMKNTNYDLNEALSCLALLDSVDKDKYNNKLQLENHFNFSNFPFKKSWIESTTLMFTSSKDKTKLVEEDSLKTHPDCKARIEKLKNNISKYNKTNTKKFIVSTEQFTHLKHQFDYEILNYCFENNEVSRCLYYALEMLPDFSDQTYLHTTIGKCLNEIYRRQKAHDLGKIVDLPGPDHNEEYNKLLNLIQNTRLKEIASLSFYFMQQYQEVDSKDKQFESVFEIAKENFNNQ